MTSGTFFSVSDVRAGYGASEVLQGVTLDVHEHEIAVVLGRNGVGKTTLIHSIMGIVCPTSGSIRMDGVELVGRSTHKIARSGVGLVPQGRRIFAALTVEENLRLAIRGRRRTDEWTLDRVYELFPRLHERRRHRGDQLSGGEQQMIAISRALLGNPRLLLLDEPSEGLAPIIVDEVMETLQQLRLEGLPMVLIEQDLHVAMGLASTIHIMVKGSIAYTAPAEQFRGDKAVARELLSIT
jgi:branched-chain amino acid transport system ATP-binding protein